MTTSSLAKNSKGLLKCLLSFSAFFVALHISADGALAYIGPGAGFAFLGSAFVFLLTIAMAVVTIAFWPLQWVWRKFMGKRISKNARTRRVVIVGLDGLEPKLVDKYMGDGKLPNLKALGEEGSYNRLGTTLPSLSPVAWSTFQTGVNPGAHNIFDFLSRDKRTCLPELSSTRTDPPKRLLSLGRYIYPISKPKIQILRKSKPFWKILSRYGIFSNIVRVPISYPPEKFYGNILSAMCTPDLKGTQGSFTAFTNGNNSNGAKHTGGRFELVEREGNIIRGKIEGPNNPFLKKSPVLTVPFEVTLDPEKKQGLMKLGKEEVLLKQGEFSEWMTVEFKCGLWTKVSGICRFCLRSVDPEFFLYMSPLNINPEKPALPISHPVFFSTYLAKKQGLFGTLGLMEDTWGRNELALNDEKFLEQAYMTHQEREEMFFNALDKTREGVCACVFDATDRIQHMFWRYLDDQHPSPRESEKYKNTIPDLYERMDDLVGRVRAKINPGDVLIVLSDHGFTSFRRCVNLNTWLYQNGYLALKGDAPTGADYLQDVDWSKTKAYGIGLAGIYINKKGRERQGIVSEKEAEELKREISQKLEELSDPQNGQQVIRKVYDSAKEYRGIYREDACDLIVGAEIGYRVSWESVTGGITDQLFEDNLKAWSGDHDVDPKLVPGVLFTNIEAKSETPNIIDMAPTVLDLFAVPVPAYMEGKVVI